ncbi:MAG TPA: PEP-CTERM sorting domain-containing protein [Cyanobacteria bacterium UBA11149]|nr:PEP-CTERM sorting domain-containing protein [Cyanobacteria bacterium UBA11367]HBE56732.1 PEP-CTERM sorting domain-containing protein [Cyanobacteria bacterium UBA11366]HBK65621.1 PEP-CTERM sorting domain-containing protein [Cyanobacteria bacterium UBA11166]HBR74601.1 PEP-CTERM sorting domain-containing protein [Cyanobacteria bacterium UBA11159]HBS72636.1 PEP-CTERM sorting domain-containing protein [Cyanobacteria bacterium UBA11153]HBW89409.1 PEP-CTERM sorting domain-containing protein [Cyano
MAFTITQNNLGADLLNALIGDTSGLSNFAIAPLGNPEAFGLFNNDPFGFKDGIVLSTGKVTDIPGENQKDGGKIVTNWQNVPNDLSTDFVPAAKGVAGMEGDDITLNISFDVDSSVDKLFFQYVFGSEEFVEFGNSEFNDSFELLLNGVNLAKLSDGKTVTINNLIPVPTDPTSYHLDFIGNPAGTGTQTKLDGYTKVLGFEGILNKNARNTLTINIKDIGDGYLDSAVFIKGKSLGTTPQAPIPNVSGNGNPSQPSERETPQRVVEPSTAASLLGLGLLGIFSRRKRGES